ncbi:MAG: serine/threonine-protein kinase [Vicinamibacterales bacterium]
MTRSAVVAEPFPPALPPPPALQWLTRVVVAIAVAKIGVALAVIATHTGYAGTRAIPGLVLLAHVAVFGGAAAFLATAGRHDRRAVHLGVFFLLVAVSFANGLLARLEGLPAGAGALQAGLLATHPDAWLPLYLWLFVEQFPRLHRIDRGQRLERGFVAVAAAAGGLLFLASASAGAWLPAVAWGQDATWFDAVIFGLALPALPFGLWKAARADVRERRRYRLFVVGLAAGFLPMALQVFAEAALPAYEAFINVSPRRLLVGLVLYPLLLSIPITTAYAVLVHRVMDVKVLVRRAVQYALARYTIMALAAAPAMLLAVSLVENRDQTIAAFVSTSAGSTAVPLAVLLVVLAVRRPLLDRIDRMFFREAVDARVLLGSLASAAGVRGDSLEGLCRDFSARIQETLHLAQADVLVADWESGRLTSGTRRLRSLPVDSPIVSILAGRHDALVVELDQRGGWAQDLPIGDQQWLADGEVHLLVPLRSDDDLVGILALGEKLSDLPFSRDDQAQLAPVAAALALKVENLRLRETPAGGSGRRAELQQAAEDAAVVCTRCSFVARVGSVRCERCGGELAPSQLPALLSGKFRLQRELGRGGMGVVYLAVDTGLERPVAIKTLPRVSLAESVRLRREARAMAAFAHPNLAFVYGLETWRGAPALVMEYLDGGTLADRLRRSKLPPDAVVTLAHDLAGAVARLHDEGVLHRDIKPSNIAFTSDGQPKLLDFGLAQIFVGASTAPRGRRGTGQAEPWLQGADLTTVDHVGRFAGTPAYMAPEAVGGEDLDATADLWSLGVVLFECLTGERPFVGRPIDATGIDWTGEIRARAPECPSPLAELVGDLLSPDRRHRPSSAHVVRRRLAEQATLRVA